MAWMLLRLAASMRCDAAEDGVTVVYVVWGRSADSSSTDATGGEELGLAPGWFWMGAVAGAAASINTEYSLRCVREEKA